MSISAFPILHVGRTHSVPMVIPPQFQGATPKKSNNVPEALVLKPARRRRSFLNKMIELAMKIDGKNRFKANSVTNRLFQELFPRERGIIVYGSSRTPEGSPEYAFDKEVGAALGRLRIKGRRAHVVDGGGPGGMRAIGEGATSVGAHAVGVAMNFIGETPSDDVHPEFVVHPNFSERIDGEGGYEKRAAYTGAVPGGPGTEQEIWKKANELFYDQTKKPCQKQIVLFDFDHYFSAPRGFIDHVKYLIERGKANPKMIDLFKLAETPEEGARFFLDKTIPWTSGTEMAA